MSKIRFSEDSQPDTPPSGKLFVWTDDDGHLKQIDDTGTVIDLAGGLQEDDVTNPSQVKAFDSTDYATSAQGSTADSAIQNVVADTTPQLGGDLDLNGKNIDFPTTANISDCLDEDNMASDSATKLATQQSIKAYVDTETTENAIMYAIALG